MATAAPPSTTLHLHHLQLFGICSIGQYALQQLLMDFSLTAHPSSPNAFEALSQILTLHKDKVRKKFSSIFTTPTVRDAIYLDVSKDIFHSSIPIDRLDINTLMEILREIKDFHSASPSHHAGWTCSDISNHRTKCCVDCDHKCSICGKDQCKKNICCDSKKKCAHKCNVCNSEQYDCVENKYVCCSSCKMCLNCVLNKHSLSAWNELYERCVDRTIGGICDSLKLRLSIKIIHIFRNITMHLTSAKCDDMDKGSFKDPKAPAHCDTWKKIRETLFFAVKFVLDVLKKNGPIGTNEYDQQLYTLRSISSATSVDPLKFFDGRIQTFLSIEGYTHTSEVLEDICQKFEAVDLKMSEKSLKLDVKFALQKDVDFDLDCEEAVDIENRFHMALTNYESSLQAYMVDYRLENSHIAEAHMIRIEFKISSTELSFKEYADRKSGQSLSLWNEIKKTFLTEEFQKKFPFATKITRGHWELGSLIIHVVLLKESGENWTECEHQIIDLFLPSLSASVVNYLPLVECCCRRLSNDDAIGSEPSDASGQSEMKVTVTFNIPTTSVEKFLHMNWLFPDFLTAFWQSSWKNGVQIKGVVIRNKNEDGKQYLQDPVNMIRYALKMLASIEKVNRIQSSFTEIKNIGGGGG
uniref:Uncharacterized protein n=2 Tax=Clytia hemisphaerica TaxID=252671 RepID=A0A7M5X3T8_9CNID